MNQNQIKQLLSKYSGDSSSLLFSPGSQDGWWMELSLAESYRPMIDEIRLEAEQLLTQPAPDLSFSLFRIFGESGSRLEYERVYFIMRKRLNTFTLMSLLEPEREDYVEALQETIWSVCNEYTWCLPAHAGTTVETTQTAQYSLDNYLGAIQGNASVIDLFAAETGFALSEVLRLMENRLPLLLRNRITHEIYRRIFWPYLHQGPFTWETATHNWAAVCAGSIGSAALHMMKDEDDLAKILERVLGTLDSYLEGFEEDGATTEGYGYWYYGFGFFVFFADLLKKRTAGCLNLFSNEKIHRIALFQQKCFMTGSSVVNFSDSMPESHIHMGLTHYLNRIYPDVVIPDMALRTSYTEDHCNRWATALRNILWFQPDKASLGEPWGQATYYLNDAEWLISRYANDEGVFCFAAKGGHNNEPHNHNDVGHFIMNAQGETFLADLGSGMYTKSYFGAERYSYLCNGSQGHSVPIINGHLQKEGAAHRAEVLNVALEKDRESMRLNLAAAYEDETLLSLERSFTWCKKEHPILLLEDSYQFSEVPEGIVERFVTCLEPDLSGESIVIPGKEQRLTIGYDHHTLQPHVQSLEFTDHFGVVKEVFAIDFTLLQPEKICKIQLSFQFE
ncbi:heparinase II/III-family protein [Paenibacillus radicis (ex Xue et al. 2023)]|uniref:Heparinase II/III-family protein n=1 Tax=Paenibacillus radicis (ex Xue et al. 2023) TaxID=2972489 RepID=A0ABT1YPR9_9BACL|nr:heparinase II/III-family protein [Paenibacillus radicis (ex Xue et al. 2023)]MCR8633990.1 heparinase II/III-family protein [Paenibacillus radicis (ex Xue et al. 2023)]